MSYASLLLSTSTVRRYTEGTVDAYGVPVRIWGDHLTSEPCRLASPEGREIKVGAELVLADYKMFLQDIEVTEQDRILHDSITYEILLVQTRRDGFGDHHKELFLRVVR